MALEILYVGRYSLKRWSKEIHEFELKQNTQVNLVCEKNIEVAYNHLFSQQVGVAVIDSDFGETIVSDFINTIKNDVALHHIFVMVITPHTNRGEVKAMLQLGADKVISLSRLSDTISFLSLRPLLLNALVMSEKITRATNLQDEAVTDYIMLDLIKDYVPQTIWQSALKCADTQKLELPEEEKEATVVFGDIAGFTRMSEKLTPKEVISTLNDAFEVVTRYVYENKGDIDKFIGDAFFAVFDSPEDAARCMYFIQKEFELVNKFKRIKGKQEIHFRISIHTGPVIRGNVGGHNRFDNTLIGDTVNTASRLEQCCPAGEIVISDRVRELLLIDLPDNIRFKVKPRGKNIEIVYFTVYEHFKQISITMEKAREQMNVTVSTDSV